MYLQRVPVVRVLSMCWAAWALVTGCGEEDPPPEQRLVGRNAQAVALEPRTLVGATDGEFQVGAGGEAMYSLPLTLVGGTAGLSPQLRLIYNSAAEDSVLG